MQNFSFGKHSPCISCRYSKTHSKWGGGLLISELLQMCLDHFSEDVDAETVLKLSVTCPVLCFAVLDDVSTS